MSHELAYAPTSGAGHLAAWPVGSARRGYQLGLPQTKLLASVVLPLPL
jgi:hypothetical protein